MAGGCMKRAILLIVLAATVVSGCGKEEKTYSEALEDGFQGGYVEALWQYDEIIAEKNKLVVNADKYRYLIGYHDVIKEAYDQGYNDAKTGKDTLENYVGRLTWHNIGVNEE